MAGDASPAPEIDPFTQRRFVRGAGPGFDRAVFFTDAVYAIAMTLIVVGLEPPTLPSGRTDSVSAMWSALGDMSGSIVMFFVTFVVIGQYWIANHRFTEALEAIDSTLVSVNIAYLAMVAFLPFPSALLGDESGNPVAVALFAGCLAVTSLLGWVLLWHARRAGLLTIHPDDGAFRWMSMANLNPVVWFGSSIVVAFNVGPTVAMLWWILAIPAGRMIERRRPDSLVKA